MPDRDPGFQQRTAVRVGFRCTELLEAECHRLGSLRPAVVIDAGLLDTGVGRLIKERLPAGRVVPRPVGEPSYDSVRETARAVRDTVPDGLVAVGGGSTIDTTKLVRGMLASGTDDIVTMTSSIQEPLLPFVALPTTAGTGAEVGAGAIVTDPATQEKRLVKDLRLAADVALADAELTLELPATLTAYTGCDAFAQALLAFVAAGADSISGQLALRAMRLIHQHLPAAVDRGGDRDARSGMMMGSVVGAMAMFNAPPTYAGEHGFAEPIGSILGVHHGHLVATFLAPVAELNSVALATQYAEVARELGIVERGADGGEASEASEALVSELRTFVRRLGVQPLSGVVADYPVEVLIARCRLSGALDGNPVDVSDEQMRAVFEGAYSGSFSLTA